jgi:hypothetical protein
LVTLEEDPIVALTSTLAIGDSFRGSEFRSRTAPVTELGPLRQLASAPANNKPAISVKATPIVPFRLVPIRVQNHLEFPQPNLLDRQDNWQIKPAFPARAAEVGSVGAGAAVRLTHCMPAASAESRAPSVCPEGMPAQSQLSDDDDRFLEELEKAAFAYFWKQTSPQTGLVKDRCKVNGQDSTTVGQHRRDRLRTDSNMHWP